MGGVSTEILPIFVSLPSLTSAFWMVTLEDVTGLYYDERNDE